MPAVFGTVAKRGIPCLGTCGACGTRARVRYRFEATVNAAGTCLPDWLPERRCGICIWRAGMVSPLPPVSARVGCQTVWRGCGNRGLSTAFLDYGNYHNRKRALVGVRSGGIGDWFRYSDLICIPGVWVHQAARFDRTCLTVEPCLYLFQTHKRGGRLEDETLCDPGGRWHGCSAHAVWVAGCVGCRAAQSLADWLGSWGWQVFGTLTVARNRVDWDGAPVFPAAMGQESFSRRWSGVMGRTERELGRRVVGVLGIESHVSGYPHGHFLAGFQGGVQPGDFKVLVKHAWKSVGFCRLEYPRSVAGCVRYASKYLLKEGRGLEWFPDPLVVGARRFRDVLRDPVAQGRLGSG